MSTKVTASKTDLVLGWLRRARIDWPNPGQCHAGGPLPTLISAISILVEENDRTKVLKGDGEQLLMWAIDTANSNSDVFGPESKKLAEMLREYRRKNLGSH